MTPKKHKAQNACAFVFENGQAHQVMLAGSELLALLEGYFKSTHGTGIEVNEEVFGGLAIGEPEKLPSK